MTGSDRWWVAGCAFAAAAWGPYLAEQMKDPEFRAMYERVSVGLDPLADPAQERLTSHREALQLTDRPPAEFSRTTLTVVYAAFVTGVVVIGAVVWLVLIGWWLL